MVVYVNLVLVFRLQVRSCSSTPCSTACSSASGRFATQVRCLECSEQCHAGSRLGSCTSHHVVHLHCVWYRAPCVVRASDTATLPDVCVRPRVCAGMFANIPRLIGGPGPITNGIKGFGTSMHHASSVPCVVFPCHADLGTLLSSPRARMATVSPLVAQHPMLMSIDSRPDCSSHRRICDDDRGGPGLLCHC
jgi:hypothetical protein